jgi:outer membrane protein assembly factor BamE (lipoprotein component of BamABCDE complex)
MRPEQAALQNSFTVNHTFGRFAELIQKHRFAVGMTAQQVRESIGEPSKINRTVGHNYSSEHWIYGDTYLYLDNGVLRSFQDSR